MPNSGDLVEHQVLSRWLAGRQAVFDLSSLLGTGHDIAVYPQTRTVCLINSTCLCMHLHECDVWRGARLLGSTTWPPPSRDVQDGPSTFHPHHACQSTSTHTPAMVTFSLVLSPSFKYVLAACSGHAVSSCWCHYDRQSHHKH